MEAQAGAVGVDTQRLAQQLGARGAIVAVADQGINHENDGVFKMRAKIS